MLILISMPREGFMNTIKPAQSASPWYIQHATCKTITHISELSINQSN